jgi:hypothetical protein
MEKMQRKDLGRKLVASSRDLRPMIGREETT